MRIGELSKMYGGVDRRTIDFYTGKGLLVGKQGRGSKYRDYDQKDVERLGKILIFREMGLSINEIEIALNDESYWTPTRLDQHITMLKENQARENERYEKMIQFAETMKVTAMAPIRTFKPEGISVERYAKYWVKAYQSLPNTWDDEYSEDIAQFDDMLNAFISHIAIQMDVGYEASTTQKIMERLASRLMSSIGIILYLACTQIVASDAIFALFEQEIGGDADLDEDDIAEVKSILYDLFILIADWCRTAKTKERICDSEALQQNLTVPLQKLCEKHNDDTLYTIDSIKGILGEVLGTMTAADILETFITPAIYYSAGTLDEMKPGLANFIVKAIQYFASNYGHDKNVY